MSGLKGYSRKIFKKYKYFDTQNLSGTELLFNSLSKQVKLKQFKIKTKKRKGLSKFGNNFFTNFYILKSLIFLLKHFFVLKEEGKQ